MAVTKITRAMSEKVEIDVANALEVVAEKHGLCLSAESSRWKFNDNVLKFPVKFELAGDNKELLETEREREWNLNCARWGLKPEHFGKVVELNMFSGTYKIVGCKPNSPKNNILILQLTTRTGRACRTEKEFVCPHTTIVRALEK